MLEMCRTPQGDRGELTLHDGLLVGRGTERECYRHPDRTDLCIKVTHRRQNLKHQNAKDFAYFRTLARRRVDWSHLPRCHGWVATDRGPGLVFDLLQDARQHPLPSVEALLAHRQVSLDELRPAFRELHDYLLRNRIFSSDLHISNILADADGPDLHLYVVDGIGDRDFIKLASHVSFLGRRKVNRQWRRFERRTRTALAA